VIGTIILIAMMATGFLGYEHSPKWFNISISYAIFLIIVYYAIQNLVRKSKVLIYPVGNIKNTKYNGGHSRPPAFLFISFNSPFHSSSFRNEKLNNKSIYLLNRAAISGGRLSKTRYSTIPSLNKSIETSCSPWPAASRAKAERLNTIIKELGLNPVYIFENLDSENIRKQILNEAKGLSGIYMIVNKITKDYYIGSAATNRFYARFSNHLIYFRGSKIVKSAVKKYELNNFAFIILELYPNIVTKENNKELLDLEDKYLKLLLPNYNILTEAGSSFGYKHTEVDRKKMKDIYTDARREMVGSLNRGKKFSPETIEKMREKALNRSPMSDETKIKCIRHTRPVVLYNLNGTVYGEYSTILEAANSINCSEKTIRRALKTEKGLVKRQ
jgi:group I intron endonuclease